MLSLIMDRSDDNRLLNFLLPGVSISWTPHPILGIDSSTTNSRCSRPCPRTIPDPTHRLLEKSDWIGSKLPYESEVLSIEVVVAYSRLRCKALVAGSSCEIEDEMTESLHEKCKTACHEAAIRS